jgi:hypothetical protein
VTAPAGDDNTTGRESRGVDESRDTAAALDRLARVLDTANLIAYERLLMDVHVHEITYGAVISGKLGSGLEIIDGRLGRP